MPNSNRRDAPIALALPALLLLTYVVSKAALTGPFVFDDFPNLGNLARMAGVFDLRHLADYLQSFLGNPGRPLAALSFLIDDAAWPSSPGPFKRTNLLIHLLCGVLVFGTTRSLARARLSGTAVDLAGLFAAAAWLLHPMQLSTSMLVVQRMTQLMTLTSLATVWWASAYLQRAPLTLARSLRLLAVTALGTVVAYLCKENGALLPLYVAVVGFTWLHPTVSAAPTVPRRLLLTGLLLPIAMAVLYLAWLAIHYVPDGLRDFTPGERVLTQFRVLLEYLSRIALPRLNGSGLFHDDYIVSRGLLAPATTLPAVLIVLGLVISAFALRRRTPLFAFAVLWYFGGHLMESSTLPLELYFEHRNYLPMVGPLAALGIWLASLQKAGVRRIALLLALAWLALCAAMTAVQAQVWGSEALLANIWARENPHSARAVELQAKALSDAGRHDDAYQWLVDAMRADPALRRLALDLVLLHCHTGRLTGEELASARSAVRTSAFNRSSLEAIATLQLQAQQGKCAPILTSASWQTLVDAMLANPVYRNNAGVAAFLWIEVAKSRIHQRRLDADDALESSYLAKPDPELAMQAYQLMRNSGQCERAERWRRRFQVDPARGFDGWMQRIARRGNVAADIGTCIPAHR